MKKNIHPQYFENIKVVCACGSSFLIGSTRKEVRTELCSNCHPFYSGKQKLVDTAGRVDKFLEKVRKTQELKEKKVKLVEKEGEENTLSEKKAATKKTAAKKGTKAKKTTQK